jgi:glycosyltransferase involved in cell wall biosynthesis
MKIGINGRFLMTKQTGVQRAAMNMFKVLVRLDRKNEYVLFVGQGVLEKKDWDYPNVHVVFSNLKSGDTFRNVLWEQFVLPRLAKKNKIDILHSPANMAPVFYRGKSIVHIHDLCFIVNPQWYSFLFRNWYRFVIPQIAKRATRVVTNSNNSKNDLLQYCKVPLDRVSLVYWAVDDFFLKLRQDTVLDRPRKNYMLYVGSLEPRKNIKLLVEAYVHLRKQHPKIIDKLLLIGGESPLFAEFTLGITEYKEDIIPLGFVGEDSLRTYYREAKLVVYPSLYEGFGFPPLEAMASGTPVVTSNSSSLPEVVGDAALTVDASDALQLSEAIYRLLNDQLLREALIRKGYERVRKFTWTRVARKVLAIYEQVYYGGLVSYSTWKELRALRSEDAPAEETRQENGH